MFRLDELSMGKQAEVPETGAWPHLQVFVGLACPRLVATVEVGQSTIRVCLQVCRPHEGWLVSNSEHVTGAVAWGSDPVGVAGPHRWQQAAGLACSFSQAALWVLRQPEIVTQAGCLWDTEVSRG